MNRPSQFIPVWLFGVLVAVSLFACTPRPQQGGTAWGVGAFDSNGERIYFTARNESGTNITYTGGPSSGMMMGGGYLTCASCHGPDGRGGVHTMMGMQTMNAPDIRGAAYNLETFRLEVVKGQHADGTSLSTNMPRWKVSDEDLADLAEYLKTLP